MGGGAAGAIKRVGGKEIETEALKHAPVPVGKAIATSAGKLNAKYVIHAPTMENPSMNIGKINVRLAMIRALNCAEEAAAIMLSTLREHINKETVLKMVIFVGYSERLADAFKSAAEHILT